MRAEPVLTQDDIRSPAWRKVKAWADGELAILRKNLESDLAPEKTAKVRGQIRSLVLLSALEVTQAPIDEEEEPD